MSDDYFNPLFKPTAADRRAWNKGERVRLLRDKISDGRVTLQACPHCGSAVWTDKHGRMFFPSGSTHRPRLDVD